MSDLHVDLDRHFHEFSQAELDDPDVLSASNEDRPWSKSLTWAELLKRKRVVMLAAAGSGKTHELETQRNALLHAGQFAFFLRLEELAREPLAQLLLPEDLARYEQWKKGAQTEAWFFLDAVDELKLNQGKLEQALRRMCQAIDGDLHRAHVIISSRPSDWRVPADAVLVQQMLPLPVITEQSTEPEASSEAAFIEAICRSGFGQNPKANVDKQPKDDGLITVLLLPLADRHITHFAQHRGVLDSDRLLEEVARSNAWIFARRPLDLDDLISLWKTTGKLGTREEQHDNNVRCKLRDNPERPDSGVLTDDMANEGAERMALAMTLTRCRTAKAPGSNHQPLDGERQLNVADILPDWTDEQRGALLRRPVFDPATLGRVRFHHRSVHEYLAARRLYHLREKGMSVRSVFRLLFAEKYGEHVVIPSMRPVAAWLSLWDADVSREVVEREPDVLIEHGDPGSLNQPVRASIVTGFVTKHRSGGWRGFRFPMEQIERIANPDLAAVVTKCWGQGPENPEVRDLLLNLIHKGRISQCVAIAHRVALTTSESANHRVTAIRSLVACKADMMVNAIAGAILAKPNQWPLNVVNGVINELFPAYWNSGEVVQFLSRHEAKGLDESSDGTEWALRAVVQQPDSRYDERELRSYLTLLIKSGATPGTSWHNIGSRYRDLCPPLATLCLRELANETASPDQGLLDACVVSSRLCGREGNEEPIKTLRAWFSGKLDFREAIFWTELRLMDQLAPSSESWSRFHHTEVQSVIGSITLADRLWIERALFASGSSEKQAVALHAWIKLWAIDGGKRSQLPAMRARLTGNPSLLTIFDARTQKPKDAEESRKLERESKKHEDESKAKEAKRVAGWKKWRDELMQAPAAHFNAQRHRATIENLYHCMNGRSKSSCSHGVWSHANLMAMFNRQVAEGAREAFKREWRTITPKLWTERLGSERNGIPYVWVYGLCGVMAEAEMPGWAKLLSPTEAKLATRLSMVEINGFASFIRDLAADRPREVEDVLGTELAAQLAFGGAHSHLPALQDLTHADQVLKILLKPRLLAFLTTHRQFDVSAAEAHWGHNIGQILDILAATVTTDEAKCVGKECLAHLKKSAHNPLALTWLRGVFRFAPEQGVEVFIELLSKRRGKKANDWAMEALAALFGSWNGIGLQLKDNDQRAAALGKLVRCAYRVVRPDDDAEHEGGYTPDTRDEAERARSFLLSALIETPGAVAQQFLMKLANERDFKGFPDRLRHLARERAAKDAEFKAWPSTSIVLLDRAHELPPSDRDGLFQIMVDRLEDIQHDILHHDFTDRSTLMKIQRESEMQRALALKLMVKANGAYSVAREEEVADEKKTDIRLIAANGAVKAAIEIKIADNRWTLDDLEIALRKQLVGQYLRHSACRAGCLLLTSKGNRKTWSQGAGKPKLSFDQLIAHLNQMAAKIEIRRDHEVKLKVIGLMLIDFNSGRTLAKNVVPRRTSKR